MTEEDQKRLPSPSLFVEIWIFSEKSTQAYGFTGKILQKLQRDTQSSCFSAQKPGRMTGQLFAPHCVPLPVLDGVILLYDSCYTYLLFLD